MDTSRIVPVLGGTLAFIVGLAVAGWAISTLWTYQRYVSDAGSFTSRFALRSLAMGAIEVVMAVGLVYLAVRCLSSKPFGRTAELASH